MLLPTVYEDGGISGGTLERPGPAALARRHQCWSRRAGGDLQGRPADPLSCRLCEARRTARDARPNRADLLAKFSRSVISKKDRSIYPIYFRTLTARANRSCDKSHKTRMGQDAGSDLCFEVSSRDRIAPDCAIRHPVRPIVALQRRMSFSAQLAGFCRMRWHQRRARRAERASFSAFVSNPDFRVPRLRPNRRTGADLAVRPPRRSHPSDPESRPGLSRRSWPSTFWSRCSPGLLDVHLSPGLDPGSRSSPESVASRPVPKLGPFEIDRKSAA